MRRLLYVVWLVAFGLGLWGVGERLVLGHRLAAYGSYVVWGLWVSVYIYLIGLSAGAFLLSSLVYVFRVERLERIGKLALFTAVVTLLTALLSIWFDLGHMERFYRVYTSPNFRSMMAWMIWLYTGYFLVLLGEAYLAFRPDLVRWSQETGRSRLQRTVARWLTLGRTTLEGDVLERERKVLQVLATVGVPLAVAFHGGVGALFATVSAKMYWHQSIVPILFLTGALVSGGGLLTAVVAFAWPQRDGEYRELVSLLGRVLLLLVAVDVLLEWAEFSIPLWYGTSPEGHLLQVVLFGPYWWVFWVLHLGLGTLVPVVLLVLRPRDPAAVGWAGLLVAATFLSVRLNVVIPAQIEPALRGLERAFTGPRLVFSYVPSVHEWLVTLFVLATTAALLWLGARLLPLMETEVAR
ncbi:MAG: NrfD/PsrC family molybdoenzyme membrane anchor subunit [Armatimonadota bacterium]|nr:NrfD/PsrC family molybdoenzyme membrane anchor subunit [Armatimonadota bacterium]